MPSRTSSLPRPRASSPAPLSVGTKSRSFRERAGSASNTLPNPPRGLPTPVQSRSVRRQPGIENSRAKSHKSSRPPTPLDLPPPQPLPLTQLPNVPPKLSRQASAPAPPSNKGVTTSRFLSEHNTKPSSLQTSPKAAVSPPESGKPLSPITVAEAAELTYSRSLVEKRDSLARSRSKCIRDWVSDVANARSAGVDPSAHASRPASQHKSRQDWANSFLRGKEALANTGRAKLGLHDSGASTSSSSSMPFPDTQPVPTSAGALALAQANAKLKAGLEANSDFPAQSAKDQHRDLLLDDTLVLLEDTEAQLDEALAVREAADHMVDMLTDKLNLQMDGAESLLSTALAPNLPSAVALASSPTSSQRTVQVVKEDEEDEQLSPALPVPPSEDASVAESASVLEIEMDTETEDGGEAVSEPSLTESARERFLDRVHNERLMGEGRWYRANRRGGAELLLLKRKKGGK